MSHSNVSHLKMYLINEGLASYLLLCQKFLFPSLLDSLPGVCVFPPTFYCLSILGREPLTIPGDPARVYDRHHPETHPRRLSLSHSPPSQICVLILETDQ